MKNNLRKSKLTATLLGLTLGLILPLQASAWISSNPTEKEYKFKFTMNKEIYEYSLKSNTYEQAFDKAAQACFQHYKGGRRISEDRGLDIIDVCANPRTL